MFLLLFNQLCKPNFILKETLTQKIVIERYKDWVNPLLTSESLYSKFIISAQLLKYYRSEILFLQGFKFNLKVYFKLQGRIKKSFM